MFTGGEGWGSSRAQKYLLLPSVNPSADFPRRLLHQLILMPQARYFLLMKLFCYLFEHLRD